VYDRQCEEVGHEGQVKIEKGKSPACHQSKNQSGQTRKKAQQSIFDGLNGANLRFSGTQRTQQNRLFGTLFPADGNRTGQYDKSGKILKSAMN
jgi:hypothetical protein